MPLSIIQKVLELKNDHILPIDKTDIFNGRVSLAIDHLKNNNYLYMIVKSRSKNKWYVNPYQELPYSFFEISDDSYQQIFNIIDENPT
jgi:hypothetical protein